MNFLYIIRAGLPNTAQGIRVYNIAKMLNKLGHNVTFMSEEYFSDENKTIINDGFKYIFREKKSKYNIINRLSKLSNFIFANDTYKRIQDEFEKNKYDGIILYNDRISLSKKIIKNIKTIIIHDTTEMYSYSFKRGFYGNIVTLLTRKRSKIENKYSGIISISNYLYEKQIKRNNNVILIPPLFDLSLKQPLYFKNNLEKDIIISYAGSPKSKDLLLKFLKAVILHNKTNKIKIKVNLIGININYFNFFNKKIITKDIVFHGYIDNDKAKNIIANSDFTILFRKKRTNTLAGYSTKLAESLSLGTPVICNKIGGSDIDITDGKNGFKINKYSMKYLKDILRKISKMDVKEINDLKNKSYIFAKSRYNINDHSKDFEIMLSKAKTTVK